MALEIGIDTPAGTDDKVRVSANDLSADRLINKIESSDSSLNISESNDGGNEKINLSVQEQLGGGMTNETDGSKFGTSGGGTWTVDNADIDQNAHIFITNDGITGMLIWNILIRDSTISGSPTILTIDLPDSIAARQFKYRQAIPAGYFNGTANESISGLITAAGNQIELFRFNLGAFVNGTNNRDFGLQVITEIE